MNNIIQTCRNRNKTIDKCLFEENKSKSLLTLVREEFEKRSSVENNGECLPQDLFSIIEDHIEKRSGKEVAKKAGKALESNTLMTADHYGGIYSAQSMQGDLLYYAALKASGYDAQVVPIMAYGQVPMNNSTFPRGIILYENNGEPLKVPVTPSKYRTYCVSQMPPFSKKEIEAANKKIKKELCGKDGDSIAHLVEKVYCQDVCLNAPDYKTQVYHVSNALYKTFLGNDEFVFVECEEVFGRLLLEDLKKTSSFVHRMIYDEKFFKALKDEFEDLSLFVGIDEKNRVFPLIMEEPTIIKGTTRDGEEICYELSDQKIEELLGSSKLYVSMFGCVLMSSFQRGITLYGGEFQAVYLEEWKEKLMKAFDALEETGHRERIEKIYCKGYLSGPIFLLTTGNNGLVNAGPVEMIINNKTYGDIAHLLEKTSVYDANVMGMYEFYNDLTLSNEKNEGWYDSITSYFKEKYEGNSI